MFDEGAVAETAARHHGLLLIDWLRALGVSQEAVSYRTRSGVWVPVHPGVFRVAAVPATWQQQLLAACLAAGPGAAVSHRAAITWWGLDGSIPGIVEVAVPRPQWPRLRGVKQVHRSTDLADDHVVTRDGIRFTTPVRTLVDYGAVAPAWRVDRAYGHALGKKLVTRPAVERMLEDVGRRGRRGVGVMRQVLEARGASPERVDGFLAARGQAILRRYGVEPWIPEYEIWSGGRFVAQVDVAWPHLRFCLEWDGDERHLGSTADDVERQNAIQEAGWDLRRLGYRHVTHDELYVVRTVRAALQARRQLVLVTDQPLASG